MSDSPICPVSAPKEVAQQLVPLFYRLRYQRSPSWFYGLSDSEVRCWKNDNTESHQRATVRALRWVSMHPDADLTKVIRGMNRSNREIHEFCKNFLDSLQYTGHLEALTA